MKTTGHRLFSLGLIAAATLCCFGTADAQTNEVVATPQQLTFNTQTGVTTPSQTILLSTASGSASVTSVVAHSDTGWLTVSSPTGTSTPLVLTVSIGAGAPSSGVDVGFINILSGTTILSSTCYAECKFNGRSQRNFGESQLAELRFCSKQHGSDITERFPFEFELQCHRIYGHATYLQRHALAERQPDVGNFAGRVAGERESAGHLRGDI